MTYETCPDCGSVGRHHYAHCLLGDQPRVEIADVLDDGLDQMRVHEGATYMCSCGRTTGPMHHAENGWASDGAGDAFIRWDDNGQGIGEVGRGHNLRLIDTQSVVDAAIAATAAKHAPKMTKTKLLDDAKATVADRGVAYGGVEDNFARIARLWNAHMLNRFGHKTDLTPGDVAMMMVLMKTARLENQPNHPDSWTDIAGYAACGAEITA